MAYVVSQQANSLAQQANSLAQQAVAAAKTNPAACAVLAAYYQGLADECRREAKQAMIQWTDSWKEPKTKQELLDEAEEYQKKADEFRSLAPADASDEPTHSRPAGNPVRPHRGARCYSRRSRRLSSRSSCRLRSCFSGGR